MSDVSFAITVVVTIVLFSEFLLFIVWMLGWRILSQVSSPPIFDGKIIRHISADIGAVTYGYFLILSVSQRGIACRMPIVLSLWHKPFFLSWTDLRSSRRGKWWFRPMIILEFQSGNTKVRFKIPERHREILAVAQPAGGK